MHSNPLLLSAALPRASHVAVFLTRLTLCASALSAFSLPSATSAPSAPSHHDIVIYGGTAAAVTAAVQAKRMGKSVVIVSPDKHLGGLSSGGLGWTDTGNKAVIGGLARDFYHRIWKYYPQKRAPGH